MSEDINVWNLVIDSDAGGTNSRGVGLAVALSYDVLIEIRELLKELITEINASSH